MYLYIFKNICTYIYGRIKKRGVISPRTSTLACVPLKIRLKRKKQGQSRDQARFGDDDR